MFIDQLTKTIKNNIGIVKMEIHRNVAPDKKFIEAIKFLKKKI